MRSWQLRRFARLPDSLRRTGYSNWGARHRRDPLLHSWLEGPTRDAAGRLLFVDVAYGRVFAATPTGEVELVMEYDGAPNGLAIDPMGDVVVADGEIGLLWAREQSGALVEQRRVESWDGRRFLGLNDLIIDEEGVLFVTDQGMTGLHDPSGRVLRVGADGSMSVLLDGVPSPNGLALRGESHELLLAVTRDNAIWRVPFDSQFVPYRVGRYIQMSGGTGPDGIALGENGFLFVAHLGTGMVRVYDEIGRAIGAYEVPEGRSPTNVFLASDEGAVYVTEADTGQVLVGDISAVL